MTIETWAAYAATELFLSLTPGPAVLLVASQGIRFGARPSTYGALGVVSGNAFYFLLSAFGLGALLIASSSVFQAVKWIGACYLVYIGVRLLLDRSRDVAAGTETAGVQPPARRLYANGLITQLANPKTVVFFSALLPQFVAANHAVLPQFLILGATSIAVEFPVLVAYGWIATRGRRAISNRRIAQRLGGALLIGTGVRLAVEA